VAGVARCTGYNWMRPDVDLVGKSKFSQISPKGVTVASLSCGRELRCGVEYPARIDSWRESNHHHHVIVNIKGALFLTIPTSSNWKD